MPESANCEGPQVKRFQKARSERLFPAPGKQATDTTRCCRRSERGQPPKRRLSKSVTVPYSYAKLERGAARPQRTPAWWCGGWVFAPILPARRLRASDASADSSDHRMRAFEIGSRGGLCDLVAKAELNGKAGEVRDYHPDKGRHQVLVEGTKMLIRSVSPTRCSLAHSGGARPVVNLGPLWPTPFHPSCNGPCSQPCAAMEITRPLLRPTPCAESASASFVPLHSQCIPARRNTELGRIRAL